MRYSLAPMEGVTDAVYRSTVHRLFAPFDRYYTPFLSPTKDRLLTARQWKELAPERNQGLNVVPQLLTNDAELFLWAANCLADLGYREVNLNLGCPSGTVVKKKKGSGLLGIPEQLEAMLDEIFTHAPIAVSVKTRLGLSQEEEFGPLLELFNRYPICELIVHPRLQTDQYRGAIRMATFSKAMQLSRAPVCYNGDLFAPEDVAVLTKAYPNLNALMLGRGAIANPGLLGYLKTGAWIRLDQFRELHEVLYERYRDELPGRKPTLFRMWELWAFWSCMFDAPEKALKQVRKADSLPAYEMAVAALFDTCQFKPEGAYHSGM